MESEHTVLECGCEFWTENDEFVFRAHASHCQWLVFVRQETTAQGKPLVILNEEELFGRG